MNKKAIILSLSATLAISSLQAKSLPELSLMFGSVKSDSKLDLDRETNIGLRVQCKKVIKDLSFGQIKPEIALSRSLSNPDYETTGSTSMTRLGVNAILNFDTEGKLVPYALLGLGREFVGTNQGENDDDGFYNYGAGIKYPINNYAFRLEAQQIEHFDGDGDRFGIFAGLIYGFGGDKNNNSNSNSNGNSDDKDNDGVVGNNDKCPYTKDGAKVDEYGCATSSSLTDGKNTKNGNSAKSDECPFVWSDKVAKEVVIKTLDAQFKLNSNKFKYPKVANDEINKFASYMKDNKLFAIVEGHTSSEGSAKSNLTLSQKRADRVRSELISRGINEANVVALGFGESTPMTDNSKNSANRRIDTNVFKSLDELNCYIADKKAFISKNALNEQK